MADTRAAPIMPVEFDDHALAADLAHHPPAARSALGRLRREIDRDGGLPVSRLKGCDAEGRDGTHLGGCVKTYVPWPTGRFGLVLVSASHPTRPLGLRAIAYGVRHPAANKQSVYKVADRRRNSDSA